MTGAPVGIIPAAGYARRLQPLACSKEVYPIGGRPVMDYLIERMRAAGCAELRVVTRPEKDDVIAHAKRRGASVITGHPPSPSASVRLGLAGLAPTDIVLVGFPDTIWDPADGFCRLLAAVEAGSAVALGLFETSSPRDLTRSDVVTLAPDGRIIRVDVKPSRPISPWIWGCAAARVEALAGLRDDTEMGVYFDELSRLRGDVVGRVLRGPWLDVGTPEALSKALARDGR